MKRLKESNSALQHTLGDKKVALAKWKEEGSSIQCTRDKETTTCKMADSLLSEIEKEKAASKRVMYQLQTDLEEVLELIAEDWRNQQRVLTSSIGSIICRATRIANKVRSLGISGG